MEAEIAPHTTMSSEDPASSADLLQDQIARYLEEEIAGKENARRQSVNPVAEVELLAHLELGEANVNSVQIGDDVQEKEKGHKRRVSFATTTDSITMAGLVDIGNEDSIPAQLCADSPRRFRRQDGQHRPQSRGRFFQHFHLAGEELLGHKVPLALRETGANDFERALEVHKHDVQTAA